MRKKLTFGFIIIFSGFVYGNNTSQATEQKAQETLNAIFTHYSIKKSCLLRETYPFDEGHKATYLADEEQTKRTNPYSYLWPFSGTLSALSALYEYNANPAYLKTLNTRTLPGLEEYFDNKRRPAGYASYIHSAPKSDRFYDDNVWLGIDFTDLYLATKEKKFLNKAELIWKFVISGEDDKLGGGIYWCEQKKRSKNTCSNAPGTVFALKLFIATGDSLYFHKGKKLYEWTKSNLQDPNDFLYYDNIGLNGRIDKTKFAYNSGQMLQAAALLYKLTKEEKYLTEAQKIAQACYAFFFHDFTADNGEKFRLINKGNVWFTAVMFRGFVELYRQDHNPDYLRTFKQNLDYAWTHMRDSDGLFSTDWSGKEQDKSKWLLTQAAMVEMYVRILIINKN